MRDILFFPFDWRIEIRLSIELNYNNKDTHSPGIRPTEPHVTAGGSPGAVSR